MFANDIILFDKINNQTTQAISDRLHFFCHIFGQKISLQKSKIYFSPPTSKKLEAL